MSCESEQPSLLDKARHSVADDHVESVDVFDEVLRTDRPANPPAGHRMRLRQRSGDDRPLGHTGKRSDRDERIAERHVAVDLVAQHPKVVSDRQVSNRREFVAGQHDAGRVVRVCEDQDAGARRNCRGERIDVGTHTFGLLRYSDEVGAAHGQGRHIGEKHRFERNDLVPMSKEAQARTEERCLGTGGDDDVVGIEI